MLNWNSNQYLKFKNERTQPAFDLANRICIDNPKNIIDIGCGPGNSTFVLKNRFPNANIIGIDNSADMISKAKSKDSSINFVQADVNEFFAECKDKFDVVFSNACIQWIPNHKDLLSKLMRILKINGVLAIQIPYNYNEPIHKIISKVTTNSKWKSIFTTLRQKYVLEISEYYDLLSEISSDFQMWQTVYFHKMTSYESILEWYRGTGLRPYLNQLNENQTAEFEKDIMNEIKQVYSVQSNGEIIFRFPRLFFIANK